ncbi:uncharacterized protein KIAA0825 homolog isoform X1 [Amblyraja radiata]|uniref:uncharacterized protein KIAA0825 homolog isoform X1 n=1 Tax=Amblyraja radiata TaxID=386614 RepID=UPI001403B120|nr:uncharacterized protein KIAA0825 homolog isoform X1 [Amblyraja radiata]XP_032873179.1 uncharacterized protein KIAA0825 homolog isoform X1 [Amblyraja radiata]
MAWEGDYHLDYSCSGYMLDCIPGDLELHQALDDIDERLKQNAAGIEETVKELQSDLDKLCAGQKLEKNGDCLQWLNSSNCSSVKLFTTPCNQLTDFLKALLHFLKTEKGLEEMIMQLLLDLSSECGVVFPLTSCGASFHIPSTTSIHTVEDNGFLNALSMWDDVRLYLRRFIIDKLQNCQEINDVLPTIQLKTQCLQQLLFLYPETEVLTRYQNMQYQSVQDLLQNKVLINISEISFDEMTHGFEVVIPLVLTMMRQDLYALRTLAEDSKVQKFINDTYLQNIASELYILIEKFCEQQLKKNALHSTKQLSTKANKYLNKQKRTVHSVVTQEQSKQIGDLDITTHQLRSLSQLIKILILLEKRMKELLSEVFLESTFTQQGRNVRGVLKKAPTNIDMPSDMNKTCMQDDQLLFMAEYVSLECDWRNAFKELAHSAAYSVKMVIEEICSKYLEQETNLYNSGKSLAMCTQSVEATWNQCTEKEPSKKVTKFCTDIMMDIDTLFPLALASNENFLQEIRENFVESYSKVAADVLSRLEERSKDVPSKVPVQNLYIILSTAIFVHNFLTKYENALKQTSKNRSLFLLPVQQYQEFIKVIQFQITSYNIRVCATSIFQDAQSHHWEDSKSFYEGERCSFSIQMWHYHCCALRHDLWSVVPAKIAQELLAEVLSETLSILASRYSQCCPTYKRTSQLRTDITAILLCTENLLWSVCQSAEELLQPLEDTSHWIFTIHNHCNALLAALAVLTSPLDKLYEVFCGGFCEYDAAQPLKPVNCGLLEWLRWIQSSFSYELLSSPSCDKISVDQHLTLLLSQPRCDWNLLLQILILQDCLVPRILLNNMSTDPKNVVDEYIEEKQSALIEAIVMVMAYCKSLPKDLGIVLEGYMDKHQLWNKLCYLAAEDESDVPRCLKLFISKAIKPILKHVISLLHTWQALENPGTCHKQVPPESLLSKIPKEWDYVPREFKRREYGKNFTKHAAQVISVLIDNLPAIIVSIPSTIKYLFNLAEKKLMNNIPELINSYLLWYVITIFCRTLEDGNATELISGFTIDRWCKGKLELVSECLLNIMGQQKENPKPVIQKIINCLEKQRPKWIEGQLQNAKKFCSDSAFLTDKDSIAQEKDCMAELTEQKISMMLLDICHQPGGNEYLRQIYHIIQLNEDWLKEQIYSQDISHGFGTSQNPKQFILNGFHQPLMFNPMHVFNHIGSTNFNQSTITEWNWDWSKVLRSTLGLSQLTFRTLLANRWEMQAYSTLEAKEKDMIDYLQKMYFTEVKDN